MPARTATGRELGFVAATQAGVKPRGRTLMLNSEDIAAIECATHTLERVLGELEMGHNSLGAGVMLGRLQRDAVAFCKKLGIGGYLQSKLPFGMPMSASFMDPRTLNKGRPRGR